MTEVKLTEYQKSLVSSNLDLARFLALEHWRRSRQEMEKDEVVTIAYQGLVNAALKFDPERADIRPGDLENGKAFAGWARKWINGAILEWQRSRDHVPKRQRRVYKNLQHHGHGAGRTAEELADITGLNVEKIRSITQAVEATAVSLDAPPENWDDSPYSSNYPGTVSVEDSALTSSVQNAVADTFSALPPLQRSVLVLRYYQGYDLTQIASELGVAVSVVRSSHRDAIEQIHLVMRNEIAP
jgi:RNA polymerase sigma factor for flagellar operon FliA